MKEIQLTQGKVAIIDDEDYDTLSKYKWHAMQSRGLWYAVRKEWNKAEKRYYTFLMHAIINNTPHNLLTDHVDGNGLNNTRGNLRSCNYSQNGLNSKRHRRSRKINYGVNYDSFAESWIVRVRINGRVQNCGRYIDLEDANLVHDVLAKKYYGEFYKKQEAA